MGKESFVEVSIVPEKIPSEIREWYIDYGQKTWRSIEAMTKPQTGLPADHLHYSVEVDTDGYPSTKKPVGIDKTSPTNVGFSLACIGAASAMEFITTEEANRRIDQTLTTVEEMMADEQVFIPTSGDKGLFINWIQPSTGQVLEYWPGTETPVKQQVSSVDNAWLIAFSKLVGAQFPQYQERIQSLLNRIDLQFMFNDETGYFRGCYLLPDGFEAWQYDTISEARIAYLICGENIARLMRNLIERRSERSVFVDSKGNSGRATWDGELFATMWPELLCDEGSLSPQWASTILATIGAQKDYGAKYNGGHYGYSAGLGPDGKYYEFRTPNSGESIAAYDFQPIITPSALVSTGLVEPKAAYQELQRLHREFPQLCHPEYGDGDTVNTQTGEVQRDQLLPNQAASLLTCWTVTKDHEPQHLFMGSTPAAILNVYKEHQLW